MLSRTSRLLIAAGLCSTAFSAAAQPTITRISGAGPSDMSADGGLVVANSLAGVVRWSRSGTPSIAIVTGSTGSTYCSNDGSVMAATVPNADGLGGLPTNLDITARWTAGDDWQAVGVFSGAGECGSISTPYDISATGRFIAGGGWLPACSALHAFIYDADTDTITDLGSLGGRSSRANGVSADGSVIVGFDESPNGSRRPAAWINGVEQVIPTTGDPDTEGGEVYALNDAGTVAIGQSFEFPGHLVRWTRSGDTWTAEDLGTIPAHPSWIPTFFEIDAANGADLSEDGSVIVGHMVYRDLSFRIRGAFLYTDELGIVDLYDYLASQNTTGLADWNDPFSGPNMNFALRVSGDGTTILGSSLGSPGWLVNLDGGPCESPLSLTSPVSLSIAAGDFWVLNAAAIGSAPMTFQWSRDGQDIPGAITQQLRLFPVECDDTGHYQCAATTACGDVVCADIDFTVTGCGCPADFDGDGFVTGLDFDAYVAAFEAGDLSSDFDGDGFVTGLDFDAYVAAFEAGC